MTESLDDTLTIISERNDELLSDSQDNITKETEIDITCQEKDENFVSILSNFSDIKLFQNIPPTSPVRNLLEIRSTSKETPHRYCKAHSCCLISNCSAF